MIKGIKRNELPFEFELSANYLQQRLRYYQSYRELSIEIGLSVNTLSRMIHNEPVSQKSWTKLKNWRVKVQEDFKKRNPSLFQ